MLPVAPIAGAAKPSIRGILKSIQEVSQTVNQVKQPLQQVKHETLDKAAQNQNIGGR